MMLARFEKPEQSTILRYVRFGSLAALNDNTSLMSAFPESGRSDVGI